MLRIRGRTRRIAELHLVRRASLNAELKGALYTGKLPLCCMPTARRGKNTRELVNAGKGSFGGNPGLVFIEDVPASTNNCNQRSVEVILRPRGIRILVRNRIFLKLAKDVTDLQTLLEVVILVRIDELQKRSGMLLLSNVSFVCST